MPWDYLRLALLYGPVWLVIAIITFIYARVGLYIYSHVRRLQELGMIGDWTENVNRIADASATDIYELTPASSHTFGIFRQQAASSHSTVRVGSGSNMAAWAYARYIF